ncbi:hypothetical protein ATCC90586_010844 [Pythium insidiosum]|nr:hypothetical protein ATCC90586_010844 [Pythium insidiosum]
MTPSWAGRRKEPQLSIASVQEARLELDLLAQQDAAPQRWFLRFECDQLERRYQLYHAETSQRASAWAVISTLGVLLLVSAGSGDEQVLIRSILLGINAAAAVTWCRWLWTGGGTQLQLDALRFTDMLVSLLMTMGAIATLWDVQFVSGMSRSSSSQRL